MNEELVLHILNTACYGLNLHFSLVPQVPYLYIFFDRSPEAVLDYPALTETIRLAAASAGLPPDYEYLALYSRILGEEHPDWETAIYLYQSTISSEVSAQEENVDSQSYAASEFSEPLENETPENLISVSSYLASSESSSEPEVDFEALFGVPESAESLPSDQTPSQADLRDEFIRDPTIVFAAELPPETSSSTIAPEFIENLQESEIDPLTVSEPVSKPVDESLHEQYEEQDDVDDDVDIDLDFIGGLPLPPPPPRHLQTSPDPSQVAGAKAGKTAKAEDDMSQYYFRAKVKPKIGTIESSPTESSTSPQADSPISVTSDSPPIIAPDPPEASIDLPTNPPNDLPDPPTADLSSYCFIRNKLMLSSTIKPPAPEVIALIDQLHHFAADDKAHIAALLDKLYRQPEKNSNEEGSGEATLYQPADINLEGFSQPIQNLIQGVLALEPESFRKSAIWFSRYCYNPPKTIGELGIAAP